MVTNVQLANIISQSDTGFHQLGSSHPAAICLEPCFQVVLAHPRTCSNVYRGQPFYLKSNTFILLKREKNYFVIYTYSFIHQAEDK